VVSERIGSDSATVSRRLQSTSDAKASSAADASQRVADNDIRLPIKSELYDELPID